MCFPYIYGQGMLPEKDNALLGVDPADILTGVDFNKNSLPPAKNNSITTFGTAKIVQLPSVTENITKLLKEQPEQR